MWQKFRGLFSLEGRLERVLTSTTQKMMADNVALQTRVTNLVQQLDHLESVTNARLSRLEVLFAEELAEKERVRDEYCKKRRLESKK